MKQNKNDKKSNKQRAGQDFDPAQGGSGSNAETQADFALDEFDIGNFDIESSYLADEYDDESGSYDKSDYYIDGLDDSLAKHSNLTSNEVLPEDHEEAEANQLRPLTLEEYCGQEKIKANLGIFIEATKARKEPLDHVLLYGPPGLGKTTLAGVIANELGVNLRITSGPAIEKAGDLAAILTNLKENDVLFIDEIHRLNHFVEEVLYSAMEDYALDIVIGKGAGARSIRIDIPPFTLVGATTRIGLLSAPLRDRFGMRFRLEMYTEAELVRILERDAAILNIGAEKEGLEEIARRSRGTPRIAIRFLKRLRDFAQVKGNGIITKDIASAGLSSLEIDEQGLDKIDNKILTVIATAFDGGPVGLDTLAAITNEDPGTLEDVNEPYLMQLGYLAKTPRGRIITDLAYEHLGLTNPHKDAEQSSSKKSTTAEEFNYSADKDSAKNFKDQAGQISLNDIE